MNKFRVKIILSEHVVNLKIPLLKSLGWNITRHKIKRTIQNPKWEGITRYGQPTAMSLVDAKHFLRVIYREEDGIIFVITIHMARRGTYESTK